MIDNDRLNHSLAIARKMVEIYYIVTTLCDKKEIANKIQETLLSKRLISGCQISERESTYWWDGKIEKDHEYHLEMRTKESLFEEIEKEIK